jgi:hypothetical protein
LFVFLSGLSYLLWAVPLSGQPYFLILRTPFTDILTAIFSWKAYQHRGWHNDPHHSRFYGYPDAVFGAFPDERVFKGYDAVIQSGILSGSYTDILANA